MDKKMKLVLHHPSGSDTTPTGLLHRYTELLKKLELESKEVFHRKPQLFHKL
jgi:transcription-repair coupling factor (superfamily II helicase)